MKLIKKILLWIIGIAVCLYLFACGFLYFEQEHIIFFPKKLSKDFKFQFEKPFEEIKIKAKDNSLLHGLLFRADSSKGLVFYLHGNAGAADTWGEAAKTYTDLNYDTFIFDYRSYGKSEGEITNENEFHDDIQLAYNYFKSRYEEHKIVIIGYSIGTGPAAHLAANNHPKMLVLQAPYYSLIDMMHHSYPIIPDFLLKYKFETGTSLKNTKAQVKIFHGDADEIIYYGSSLKLKQHFKKEDELITIQGLGHNGMNRNLFYQNVLKKMLN